MFTNYSENTIVKDLHVPDLKDVKDVLLNGLKSNFAEVTVEVVNCPDLTAEPFNLACKGLGGSTAVVEVGGPPYLIPLVKRDKVYNIKDVVNVTGFKPCFVIGAGAAPWPFVGKNAEMIANVYFNGEEVINQTHISKLKNEESNDIVVSVLPEDETRFALLANLFFSEGLPSKVLKVCCKKRTGSDNFISAMRVILENKFKDKVVGLGGAFLIKNGKALHHVMPDFSSTPLNDEQEVNDWLKFYNMSAPMVSVGTFLSSDIPGLDLRIQHFHSFSDHGEAGHYHEDTTPGDVEYIGYFNVGEKIYRIDKPVETHTIGRD